MATGGGGWRGTRLKSIKQPGIIVTEYVYNEFSERDVISKLFRRVSSQTDPFEVSDVNSLVFFFVSVRIAYCTKRVDLMVAAVPPTFGNATREKLRPTKQRRKKTY